HCHGVSPPIGLGAQREGEVQIEMAARSENSREIERSRQDADHRDRFIVQYQRAAEDAGVGNKPAFPQTMAYQNRLLPVPFAFFRSEQPAQLRLNAEQLEEIFGDRDAAQTLRFSLAAEQVVADPIEGHVTGNAGERLILFAK